MYNGINLSTVVQNRLPYKLHWLIIHDILKKIDYYLISVVFTKQSHKY